ncbi:hypothetical protein Ancab_007582 [Ancistrocladus abbreviatus]
MQIFSIDVQPGGIGFATGGGDQKVRIWNNKSIGREFQKDDSSTMLLATLCDHFGSVNCVRNTEFGSGEHPDVENWKVIMTLRGHTADVVDLNWSPHDSMLATGSLDNTIHIWNMSNGICTAVLRGHSSLVKGVAWDPIGSFIASQSGEKTVIIWRASDWSPCPQDRRSLGEISMFNNYFEKAILPSFLPPFVVSVTMFLYSLDQPSLGSSGGLLVDVKSTSDGWANGPSKIAGKVSQPYNVIAIGSQDHTITVWTTASPRPLFVGTHFFSQSVVDLSWSPDRYSLFVCSLNGSMETFYFDVKELGLRLSDDELDELRRAVMVMCAKEPGSAQSSTDLGVPSKVTESQAENGKKSEGAVADGTKKVGNSAHVSSPVKQKEYRCPDGRKRIIPEAVGVLPHRKNITAAMQSHGLDLSMASTDGHRDDNGVHHAGSAPNIAVKRASGGGSDLRSGVMRIIGDEGLLVERSGSAKAYGSLAACNTTLVVRVIDKKDGVDAAPLSLEARPKEHSMNDIIGMASTSLVKETEIICTKGSQTLWSDRISGRISV